MLNDNVTKFMLQWVMMASDTLYLHLAVECSVSVSCYCSVLLSYYFYNIA